MSKKQAFEGGELDDYIGDDELADDEMLIDGEFSEDLPEGEEGMDDMPFDDDEDEELFAARRPAKKKSSAPPKPPPKQLLAGVVDRAGLSTAEELQAAWQKLCDKLDTKNPKPYSPKAALKMEDVIQHPKFGIGFVASMLSAQKAEVIFKEGVVKLVCNK
jgi:hypothetical protein